MKERLCKAFCERLNVCRVPAGWAVQTPFRLPDGDPIMFFVVKTGGGAVRIEDDGATIAHLEASSVPLAKGARRSVFDEILRQHEAVFDPDTGVIRTNDLRDEEIDAASVKFTSLMLRVHDLALLSTERVRQSWQDDAVHDLHAKFDAVATVEENAAVSDTAPAWSADVVIRSPNAPPIAIVMGTSNAKGLQALVLKMELEKYQGQNWPVLLFVERAKENPLSEGTYALAQSRLNGVHTYRGAETEAVASVSRFLPAPTVLQ